MTEKSVESGRQAKEKLDRAGGALKKATSTVEQKKRAIDAAIKKSEEPFKLIEAKQQRAKSSMEAAKKKADAANKMLDIKKLAHDESRKRTDKSMGEAKAMAQKAKKSVEDRQRDFNSAEGFVRSLIEKMGQKAKS
ncbi:MAG TPA: hypothetical protein HA257_07755 [Candidatus Methanoperedenaceae archaeon]|nr:hypothetical protein [Candidatus Methanoperedenaceae archaeon]